MLPASRVSFRAAALSTTAGATKESKAVIVTNRLVNGKIFGATMPPNAGFVMRTVLLGDNRGEAPPMRFTFARAFV
jgi:hypothetical protein